MATNQNIRIRLKAFDHRLIDNSAREIVDTAKRTGATVKGPIPLPMKKERFTEEQIAFAPRQTGGEDDDDSVMRCIYHLTGSGDQAGALKLVDDRGIGLIDRGRTERRRRNAYAGSCMHFFRALWHNELEETPFMVRNSMEERLNYTHIVEEGAGGIKYLTYPDFLDVYYYTTWSRIEFTAEKVPFEPSGFYDPEGISWHGRMGNLRAGDWLPYDYVPDPQ